MVNGKFFETIPIIFVFLLDFVCPQGQKDRTKIPLIAPYCKNGFLPYLVRGDVLNCDNGDRDCPANHLCEKIWHFTACCRVRKDQPQPDLDADLQALLVQASTNESIVAPTVPITSASVPITSASAPITTVQSSGPITTVEVESNIATTAGFNLKPGVQVTLSCDRIPYRKTCEDGRQSQFTLRWYLKDGMCCSYAWGHCKGDDLFMEPAIRHKSDCEAICIRGEKPTGSRVVMPGSGETPVPIPSGTPISTTGRPSTSLVANQGYVIPSVKSTEDESGSGDMELEGSGSGSRSGTGQGTSSNRGRTPVTSDSGEVSAAPVCTRQPYRLTCEDGRPSQFTLRWFVMNGKCCSYAYGYCKGDEIKKESVLRKKEDCVALCIS